MMLPWWAAMVLLFFAGYGLGCWMMLNVAPVRKAAFRLFDRVFGGRRMTTEYEAGYEAGYNKGHEDGYKKGYDQGYDDGDSDAFAEQEESPDFAEGEMEARD